MDILQLCCFTDLWSGKHEITSIDIKTGNNVFDLDDNAGKQFDLIVAAPPCTQFTKANSYNWYLFPAEEIRIAKKCFVICVNSGKPWLFENPPGRIEKFLPELTPFRILTWQSELTHKEYVCYSNFLVMCSGTFVTRDYIKRKKMEREKWQPDFIRDIERSLCL